MVEEHRRHFPRAPIFGQRRGKRARHEPVVVLVSVAIRREIAGERTGRRLGGKRQPMAAYRFGGLENTLLQPGESGLMSMIG
jgi:hypothetical protein